MNQLIVNYRVDPSVAAELLPAHIRPRIVNGHAVAGLVLRNDTVEHRLAVESGAYLLHSESAPARRRGTLRPRVRVAERRRARRRLGAARARVATATCSATPAPRRASPGVVAAVPVAIDWIRSSFFDRLQATVDCALLLPDVPVRMDLAA